MATYKVTKEFKKCICEMLDKRAAQDQQFAEKYNAEDGKKSIEECCEYIVGRAYEKSINAATPQEVEGWAVHYYDEESVKMTPAPANARVVVPATDKAVAKAMAELSVEEQERLKEIAQERFISNQMHEMAAKAKPKSKLRPKAAPAALPFVEQTLF
uniref:Cas9 inhibitor AcrIIA9 family protein n=1 Tax=Alistipes sp. TaxID=1872444 RepID=UPI004057C195